MLDNKIILQYMSTVTAVTDFLKKAICIRQRIYIKISLVQMLIFNITTIHEIDKLISGNFKQNQRNRCDCRQNK